MSAAPDERAERSQLLLDSILRFYEAHPDYLETVRALNEREDTTNLPSLRQIDYCVVNYAKSHMIPWGTSGDLYSEYKDQLGAHSKDNLDPFRRGQKISIRDVPTALCQLNFFRWAIPAGVLTYTKAHEREIEDEMKKNGSSRKRNDATPKKETLNQRNKHRCIIHERPSVASFVKPYQFFE